ncbi:DUF3568 family protein [Desulfonatronospira sp.]|uniref:DUF3568 family protein n=1 Tax=Desulfonatronospira sp. TaxID=1962951 RepID=UPI0025BF28B0|nr:DUF3568 family protein [Desulfonatronospira sp.]
MKIIRQKTGILLFIFLCLNLSGCMFALGGAAGGGAAIYYKGWLRENVAHNMHEVHQASLKAMETKNITLEQETRKTDEIRLQGNYMDGTSVWINIKHQTTNTSEIRIRVGVLGDETRSRAIWDEARRNM